MLSGVDASISLTLGAMLVAFGSMCTFQHAFTLAAIFPAKTVLIVAAACTLFDASSLMFVLVKFVFDAG